MLQYEVLIRELLAVYGLPPGPIVVLVIAHLTHEFRDYPMRYAVLIRPQFVPKTTHHHHAFAFAKPAKVLARLRAHIVAKFADQAPDRSSLDLDVQEDLHYLSLSDALFCAMVRSFSIFDLAGLDIYCLNGVYSFYLTISNRLFFRNTRASNRPRKEIEIEIQREYYTSLNMILIGLFIWSL